MTEQQEAIQMKAHLIGLTLKDMEEHNQNELLTKAKMERRTKLTKLRKQVKDLLEICGVTELEA